MKHVVLLSADGALEAAPAMGSADIILDLVSTGMLHIHANKMLQIFIGACCVVFCAWSSQVHRVLYFSIYVGLPSLPLPPVQRNLNM
jgi:hypothetical protein